MSRLKKELNILQDTDVYSLMLFVLYKVRDIKEYSTLSELAYILDKTSLLKLCEYFGGTTITIPTVNEMKLLVSAMLLYQYVNIGAMLYDEAIVKIGVAGADLRKVKNFYGKLCEVLKGYSIKK